MSEALLPLAAASAGAAAVVGRLAAREQQAVAEREARQAAQQQDADAREDVAAFVAAFTAELRSLTARAEAVRGEALAAVGTKPAHLVAQLHALSLDATSLEQATSTAAFFLPAYEQRSCSVQLQQLRAQLTGAKQALQPKRKFAFATAVARTPLVSGGAAADSNDAASAPATPAQQHQEAAVPAGAEAAEAPHPRELSAQDAELIAAGHGFAGLHGRVLVATGQQLAGQAFVLHDLQDCQVFLPGSMRALRLQGLVGCAVFSGPVVGATFVDGASDCKLMLASHQVRIHSARDSDVYLRVRSRPVIEHSTGLRFAPYAVERLLLGGGGTAPPTPPEPATPGPQEPQLAEQLEAAQLAEDSGLWASVDDFGWVKATPSPNWRVLPERQRQAPPARLPDM